MEALELGYIASSLRMIEAALFVIASCSGGCLGLMVWFACKYRGDG